MKVEVETWKVKALLRMFKIIEYVPSPRNNSADPYLLACQNWLGKWYLASMNYTQSNSWSINGLGFDTKEELLDDLAKNSRWARQTNELRPEYEERLKRMGL